MRAVYVSDDRFLLSVGAEKRGDVYECTLDSASPVKYVNHDAHSNIGQDLLLVITLSMYCVASVPRESLSFVRNCLWRSSFVIYGFHGQVLENVCS